MENPLLLGPIFIPLAAAVLGLALSRYNRAQRALGVVAGGLAWVCSLVLLAQSLDQGVQTYTMGGWTAPFGIILVADRLAALFAAMSTTVVGSGLLYAYHCYDKVINRPAFTSLFLTMGAGLVGCLYTGDLFTLFVFLELMVIASVLLVAISDNPLGLEAAIKYLFISAMGTLFLLLGVAAMYATFGTLNMADIARVLVTGERPFLATEAAVMLLCAFLLKSAVFPFHFWQPDFHTTAPTPVHAVLSSVVVKVGVYGVIRMLTLLFTEEAAVIQNILVVLGLIGIFFGSLGALRTYDAKRMLAYSTFGQIGFILVAIGWGNPAALVGALVYAVNHSFIKSSLLMLTGVVSSRTQTKTARLTEIAGVGKHLALTNALYLLGGLALAGVPPLNGFISKLALVRGGIAAESWAVLGLAVGAGMITLLYMTRTWQLMFQRKPDESTAPLKDYGDRPYAPLLLVGLCVVFGIHAAPLLEVATLTVSELAQPEIYINAVFRR
ncbi:MAG: complex I subunit 5 family protein [Aggregatilineales bacterium]